MNSVACPAASRAVASIFARTAQRSRAILAGRSRETRSHAAARAGRTATGRQQARRLALAVASLAAAGAVAASPLRTLETEAEAAPWRAVGLLAVRDRGRCTATLIAPDLVLTAAHCLHDRAANRTAAPADVRFLAGWRDGAAAAAGAARRLVVHPIYRHERAVSLREGFGIDLALVQLDAPLAGVAPLAVSGELRSDDRLSTVSYAAGRMERPSLQESCAALRIEAGAARLTCAAAPGASGAPVLAWRNGRPEVVAVLTAGPRDRSEERRSLASRTGRALGLLEEEFVRSSAERKRATPGGAAAEGARRGAGGGIRFLRPAGAEASH